MNTTRYKLIIGAGALLLTLAACSTDTHTFHSSVDRPTTVTLYDPLSDSPLWIKDIPVGYSLDLDLDRPGDTDGIQIDSRPATHVSWRMYVPGDDFDWPGDPAQRQTSDRSLAAYPVREQTGSEKLPGTPVVIKVSYRPSPEHPSRFEESNTTQTTSSPGDQNNRPRPTAPTNADNNTLDPLEVEEAGGGASEPAQPMPPIILD